MKKLSLLIIFTISIQVLFAQIKKIVITNATIHIGNGTLLTNANLAYQNGKITEVSTANIVGDTIINAEGKHAYPGFIAPYVTLGLTEVDAVRATVDYAEVGLFNPHVRAQVAYNTDSKIIPTVRTNGVLLVQTTPRGGLLTGQSSIMTLAGWNWEDATVLADDGQHLNWPRLTQPSGWGDNGPTGWEKNKNYENQLQELNKFFNEAKAYNTVNNNTIINAKYKALNGVLNQNKRLYIYANTTSEIIESITFANSFGVKNICIVGAYQADKIIAFLKENKVSIILGRLHSLPFSDDEDIYTQTKLPTILENAGIPFAISNEGDMEAMHTRNLPFQAGTAAAFGLTSEQVVKHITLETAQILGIDKQYGSLEVGKSATLFISKGDALDTRTNQVENIIIQGKNIDVNNYQKQLYTKYLNKYGIK